MHAAGAAIGTQCALRPLHFVGISFLFCRPGRYNTTPCTVVRVSGVVQARSWHDAWDSERAATYILWKEPLPCAKGPQRVPNLGIWLNPRTSPGQRLDCYHC
jgi:hypothetical protein